MAIQLIVGLDGATFDLIVPWAQEGHLPVLAELMRMGSWGPLRSVPNMNSAPAWSSFATGLNPGKHGIFYFTERVPGTYHRCPVNASYRHGVPFWSLLSRAGCRVGIINVPLTYPVEAVEGFMVAGLDAPGVHSPGFTHPENLAARIQSEVGEYIIEPGIPGMIKGGYKRAALERILLTIERRLACTLWLHEQYHPDLLTVVFTATDAVQHFFWGDMDPTYPFVEPEERRFANAVKQVYIRLDQALGQLIEKTHAEQVIILSDHGFGFNQRGAEFLRPWLIELGLLQQRKGGQPGRRLVSNLYNMIDRRLSRDTKLRLAHFLPRLRSHVETTLAVGDINWVNTKVYCTGTTDDLYINLHGREPQGIVLEGSDYNKLCDLLIGFLRETTEPITGLPAVEFVARRDAVYSGPWVDRAPDILIRWSTQSVLSGLRTPGYLSVPKDPYPPPLQSGGHRLHGVFIASGIPFRQGVKLGEVNILDLAPTILHLNHLPIPPNWDGQVITAALDADWLAAHPVQQDTSAVAQSFEGTHREYTDAEASEIEERLRGMGYIE